MKFKIGATHLALTLTIVGCNPVKSISQGEKAVEEFHHLYDTQHPDLIYKDAHPELKSLVSERQLAAFVTGVHGKLGKIKTTRKKNGKALSQVSESVVNLEYTTQFEAGSGTEKFTYRIANGHAALLSWKIDSPELTEDPSKTGAANPASAAQPR